MASGSTDREKKKVLDHLLQEEFVLVHVNTSFAEVALPAHLMHLPSIPLKLSRLFRGGIELRDDRVVTDLRFGDEYFTCILPYAAIWLVAGSKGALLQWPEAGPPNAADLISKVESSRRPATPQSQPSDNTSGTKEKGARPMLRRVK